MAEVPRRSIATERRKTVSPLSIVKTIAGLRRKRTFGRPACPTPSSLKSLSPSDDSPASAAVDDDVDILISSFAVSVAHASSTRIVHVSTSYLTERTHSLCLVSKKKRNAGFGRDERTNLRHDVRRDSTL
jgi:hypothetical protein